MEYVGNIFEDVFSSYMRIHHPQVAQVPQSAAQLEAFIAAQRLNAADAAAVREQYARSKQGRDRLTMYVAGGALVVLGALTLWSFNR